MNQVFSKRKRILILMKTMNIGGAERSLLGLLNSLDYKKYDVSLLVYQHGGEFMKYIPKEVNILPYNSNYNVFEVPIKTLLLGSKIIYGIARILSKVELEIYCKLFNKRKNVWIKQQYSNKYIVPLLPKIKGKYDLGINFLGVSDVLVKKVEASKKIGWIHTDYNQLVCNPKIDEDIYSKLDYIACVSKECNNVFVKYYPRLKSKAIVVENILSEKLILKLAEEFNVNEEMIEDGTIKILSIGRFVYAKNFDNIPEICSLILSRGFKIKWYLIGFGNEELLIRRKIEEYNVQENVIILGKKENPYPYIKASNIYVQPSRFEGKAVTVREAQILKKPVVITNYETSPSQIKNNYDGIIVPKNNKECAESICDLLDNRKLQNKISNNCKSLSNENEIKKIYKIINKV